MKQKMHYEIEAIENLRKATGRLACEFYIST